jgi:type II secretory pathway pseudopilin PulG
MRTLASSRRSRRGITLVEAMVAVVIVAIVSLAAFYAYTESRVSVIHQWHQQNALYLAEREIESWQAAGYHGQSGWAAGDVGLTNWLPHGYSFHNPDTAWDRNARTKTVTLEGFQYTIRARMNWNDSAESDGQVDYFMVQTADGVTWRYREIHVHVQWAGGGGGRQELVMVTRMAR